MKNKRINKKGYYFSVDAFIALLIILGVVLFIKPHSVEIVQEVHIQQDFLNVLSNLKIGDLDNAYVDTLKANGNISNYNLSVLEQIGEFYATSSPAAKLLTESILTDLALNENIGLYFNGQSIATDNTTSLEDSKNAWASRQIIGGIKNGTGSATGFSSIAFLSVSNKIKYFYFGGYIGEGNITLDLGQNVESAKVEAVFSGPFDLSVNGNPPTSHSPLTAQPYEFAVPSEFSTGDNFLYFTATSNLYIAGGFVRVVYNNSFPTSTTKIYPLPGIDGLINIYDSFFVPGTLDSMEVFLNYTSDYNLIMTIGNKTVYIGKGTNDEVIITNSNLSGLLDYSIMDYKTIPFRLGLKDVALTGNLSIVSDIFSVTDLSASMNKKISGTDDKIIDVVKIANKEFVKIIINESITEADNRAGLVGFNHHNRAYEDDYYHNLSIDEVSLENKIDSWITSAGTCICCGINKAIQGLLSESDENRSRVMIVMSDGGANGECIEQNTGSASQDAIQAACDAKDNHNITVYAIGFGDSVDEETLQAIALTCGGGNYYYGSVEELVDIYKQAAQDIIKAIYDAQTVISERIHTTLYPSSYVSVDYTSTIPYGLMITAESEEFGINVPVGNFSLPFDATPYQAQVISYSGPKWTGLVEIYDNVSGIWEEVFNLSKYGEGYTILGDPYVVNIPTSKLRRGENSVRVYTGVAPNNLTDSSMYNKIIYSVFKNISGFSTIVASAEGCVWTVEFEDGTSSIMSFPQGYTGTSCSYTSTNSPPYGVYNPNDAISVAIFNLFSEMDLDSNGKLETKFSETDLVVNFDGVEGIPFTWETEAQVRVWR